MQSFSCPTPFELQRTPAVNVPCKFMDTVKFCACTNVGQRSYQEDRLIATELGNLCVGAVMDGHLSDEVSSRVQVALVESLPIFESCDFKNPRAVTETVVAVFKHIDDNLTGHKAGSTAVVALYNKVSRLMYLVNLGDSRGVAVDVANGLWAATVDHKPGNEDEKRRIAALCGYVSSYGTPRVQGVLAVSRAFGDFHLRPYVSADPVVYGPYLVTGASVVVLCSDGVTDVVSSAEIVATVMNRTTSTYKTLCSELVSMALGRGSTDNMTAVAMIIH